MELYPSTLGTGKALISGTPAANQVAFWSSTTAITGDAGITYTAAGGLVINEASGSAVDLRAEAETMPNMLFLDADVQMIFMSDAATGGTVAAPTGGWIAGTMLVLDNRSASSDVTYLSIMSGASGSGGIHFGDPDDQDRTAITVNHGTTPENMTFTVGTNSALQLSTTEVIVNQNSYTDMDFRCESNNFDHLLFVDSSQDIVFITDATAAPTAPTGGYVTGGLLVLQNNSVTGDNANSSIYFGDTDDVDVGSMIYDHTNNRFLFATAASSVNTIIDSNGYLGVGVDPTRPLHVKSDWGATTTMSIHNTSTADGRCVLEYVADRSSTGTWITGIDPLGGVTKDFYFRDGTNNVYAMRIKDSVCKVSVGGDGFDPAEQLAINTPTDIGDSVLGLQQDDTDEPFISFDGTSEAGNTKSLSSWTNGATLTGYVRVDINGTDYWMPYYTAPTS